MMANATTDNNINNTPYLVPSRFILYHYLENNPAQSKKAGQRY
jgi:hypothetical protein